MNLVRPITRADIKGPALYGPIRDDYRKKIIELKEPRRVALGDKVELVFDNRLTLAYQIEEVCRLENLTRDDQIADEIAGANQLMPTDDSLAATLFIATPPGENGYDVLRQLVGLDEHVVLHVGPHAIRASFEQGRSTEDKISAVQYARFRLTSDARAALLAAGTPIAVEIDHPAYRCRVQCSQELRASLAADYGA